LQRGCDLGVRWFSRRDFLEAQECNVLDCRRLLGLNASRVMFSALMEKKLPVLAAGAMELSS